MMKDAPERVARFQEVFAAPSRVQLVRILLKGSLNFSELMAAAEAVAVSRDSVHAALRDLHRFGYISDDADPTKKRKPNSTRFTADRELITADFAAFMTFTLG
jgi:DNA-binding HxlR family transcriptional regulator